MSASMSLSSRLTTTVAKELVVAVSGLALTGFVCMHLAGNLLILIGPEAFNAYAEKMQEFGPLLWVARAGLLAVFLAHVGTAISLARANRAARKSRYDQHNYVGRRSPATRLMLLTGLMVLMFAIFHVLDFSVFGHREGPRSIVEGMNGGASLGLWGVVYSSFGNPLRALFYIAAVSCVGLHLSHALSSVLVTLGVLFDKGTDRAELIAKAIGAAVALGFASLPAYVLVRTYLIGVAG
ncbi:MAG: succinate dehydrogenase cytochrome b subunit [Candidatus Hydrogenedentes bacterium]|nr:succinate dehydrogenase cytochrome b subunit [Candidatus Hydrogenedentota bacterium]